MADIFISYAREDTAWAKSIAARMQQAGKSVWWDRNMAVGADIHLVIEREIRAATKVIVLWSRHSIDSRWVRDEANLAVELNKLMPVSIDGSSPRLGFGCYNIVQMNNWDSDFQRLLQSMPAETLGYTTAMVLEDGYAKDTDALKSMLQGVDHQAVHQTIGHLKNIGYASWLASASQGKNILSVAASLLPDTSSSRGKRSRAGVRTPSFGVRLMAGMVDVITIVILSFMFNSAFGLDSTYNDKIAFVLFWCIYHLVLVPASGTTLGLKLANLQVRDASLKRFPSVKSALIIALASLFPLSFIWYFADSKKRMMHDIASRTIVLSV